MHAKWIKNNYLQTLYVSFVNLVTNGDLQEA